MMNIGWMKKTLQVEILSKDNGYVFSYTKDWLYKHRNRFEYVFHEVDDDGKDVYYSNYDIADDGTITIETSGGSGGGSEPLVVHLVVTEEGPYTYVTFDKNWTAVKNAFPNVCIEFVDDGTTFYDNIIGCGANETLESYNIVVSSESGVYYKYEKKVFTCVSADGMPFIKYGGVA